MNVTRHALLPVLLATAVAAQEKLVKLKPTTLQVAAELPLRLRHRLTDRLPEALVGKGHAIAIANGELRVDTTGDAKHDRKLSGKKDVKLLIGAAKKPLLVFKVWDTWFAGAARCLTGKHGSRPITLLDANLDGKFDSPEDFIRFGRGSFHPQHENRLLAAESMFLRYRFDADKPAVAVQTFARPAHFNPLQWKALLVNNDFRSRVGLAPLELDRKRCEGCQKHAEYLLLNNYDYSKPWDGVGSHDERPGNPGFTEIGQRAARSHGTSGTGDAAAAILGQTRTMLHRVLYLGPVDKGLGAGAVDECQNSSATGYAVTGGAKPFVRALPELVVVPAPGQRDVHQLCKRERPRPDRDPQFYSRPRGYPVSVSFGYVELRDTKIELFKLHRRRLKPVKGHLFSPDKPVSKTRATNGRTTFFVADKPLERKSTYVVRFTATRDSDPLELGWQFTTK